MRKAIITLFLGLGILTVAQVASACPRCSNPPPYTPSCVSSLCGHTQCTATSSGSISWCRESGDVCAENEQWCSNPDDWGPENVQWVRCTPRLSDRWRLVATRVDPQPKTTDKRS